MIEFRGQYIVLCFYVLYKEKCLVLGGLRFANDIQIYGLMYAISQGGHSLTRCKNILPDEYLAERT